VGSLAKRLTLFLGCLAFLFLVGCTKSKSDGDSENNADTGSDDPASNISIDLSSDCGTVVSGQVLNPPPLSSAVEVQVTQVVSHNVVIVQRPQGSQVVRILGLADNISSLKAQRGRSQLSALLGSAILVTDDCPATFGGGGQGINGQLFTASLGVSFAERLLSQNGGEADTGSTACGTNLLSSCYQALVDQAPPLVGATVSNFLWKPVAERDGNLVILLSPANASVFANGEALVNFGPSNGRGTTARANKPGCAFGANAKVEAFDSQGRPLVFPGGATSFTIANGCNRVEFQ
jgi:hypothetical protein